MSIDLNHVREGAVRNARHTVDGALGQAALPQASWQRVEVPLVLSRRHADGDRFPGVGVERVARGCCSPAFNSERDIPPALHYRTPSDSAIL